MLERYPSQQMVKAMMEGRLPLPEDKQTRAAVLTAIARYKKKLAADAAQSANSQQSAPVVAQVTIGDVQSSAPVMATPPSPVPGLLAALDPAQKEAFLNGTQESRLALLQSLPDDQMLDLLEALPPAIRARVAAAGPVSLRRRVEILNTPQQVVNRDLSEGKLLRAIYSNRQLEEVLTRFLVQPLQRISG